MAKGPFTEKLRQLIEESGMSRAAICKHIGIDQATMSRFMNGKGGMSIEALDRLAVLLRLEIIVEPEGDGKE